MEDTGARRAERDMFSSGAMLLFEVESKKQQHGSEVGGVIALSRHDTLSKAMENADISGYTSF